MSIKKEWIYSQLIQNIVSLSQMTGKTESFSGKKKFNMNLYLNIWKLYLLRKSAAILNDIK